MRESSTDEMNSPQPSFAWPPIETAWFRMQSPYLTMMEDFCELGLGRKTLPSSTSLTVFVELLKGTKLKSMRTRCLIKINREMVGLRGFRWIRDFELG